jgi:dipeptidyl aminopeptidase/acylaminoacyl peptidase
VRPATAAERALLHPPAQPFDRIEGRQILLRIDAGDARGSAFVLAPGLRGALAVARGSSLGEAIFCERPQCRDRTIISAAWQRGANRLLFGTTDGSANHAVHLWDVATGKVETVASVEGLLNGGRDGTRGCAVGTKFAVCIAASANSPPRLVRLDLATGAAATLADPNAALAGRPLPRFRPLEWSAGGTRFTGQLLVPEGLREPAPLFLTYYVCDGYLRGGTGDEFPMRQMAASGMAILCINRPPAAPGLTNQRDQYRVALSGVREAVDRLSARGIVDRHRVGMGGISFGGEITMWVAMRSDLLAAASIGTSLITPIFYWFGAVAGRDTPDILRKVWGVGDPEAEPSGWRAISPALNAAQIEAPLLMQEPEQEYRYNLDLLAKLSRSATPVEMWAFPEETHIKFQPRHKLAVYERNLDWFRFWLQGHVDPKPSKRDQYRRWSLFRRQPGWKGRGPFQSSSQERAQTSTSASSSTR